MMLEDNVDTMVGHLKFEEGRRDLNTCGSLVNADGVMLRYILLEWS